MNIRFTDANNDKNRIKTIKQLYYTSFPRDERAPFKTLVRGAKKKIVDFLCCLDEDEFIGFLYVVNHLDMSYVFYLAVEKEKRCQGYGTAILRAAHDAYKGRRLFLAIEEIDEKYDNYEERLRRLRFYENAGFTRSGQKIQEGNVTYDLISANARVSEAEYRSLIRSFLRFRMLFISFKFIED